MFSLIDTQAKVRKAKMAAYCSGIGNWEWDASRKKQNAVLIFEAKRNPVPKPKCLEEPKWKQPLLPHTPAGHTEAGTVHHG